MARPLSSNREGRFSAADVEKVMRSGAARFSCRFDLLDADLNYVGPLKGVTKASVQMDRTRPVVGLLRLTMTPTTMLGAQEAWDYGYLRNVPFQFYVKPWFQVGPMPNGGVAEFPMGVFCWQRPKRHILGTAGVPWQGSEEWELDLPDQTYLLNADGPDDTVLNIPSGIPLSLAIEIVLGRAGFSDFAGITQTPIPTLSEHAYFFWTTYQDIFTPDQQATAAENYLHILSDFHKSTAFSEPWYNLDGLYQAQLNALLDISPPSVVYDAGQAESVQALPLDSEPDMSLVANRIFAVGQSTASGTGQLTAVVDLNDWVPAHPMAQVNTRHYISVPFTVQDPPSYEALYAAGLMELARRLTMYEKITMTTSGFLALHEVDEIVGIRIPGDPELSNEAIQDFLRPFTQLGLTLPPDYQYHTFLEQGWDLDLFTGDMKHTLGRIWRTF